MGVLDSFALVEFIAVLEDQCGIKIPDADVNAGNFQTLETIERYVQTRKGTSS
jgi:acyl carrier protein